MAVPTIYARLVAAWDAADEATRRRWSDGARSLRLMVSGSAALPVDTLDRWQALTGHRLLERYGMTELGMALTNTIEQRVPGHVGEPLPGVEVRLVDEVGPRRRRRAAPGSSGCGGLQIFAGYWDRPDATAEAFADGWFRTGDIAVHDATTATASWDGPRSTSSRPAARRCRPWRSKRSSAPTRRSPTAPSSASTDPEWGQRVAIALVASGAPACRRRRAAGVGSRAAGDGQGAEPVGSPSTSCPATPWARSPSARSPRCSRPDLRPLSPGSPRRSRRGARRGDPRRGLDQHQALRGHVEHAEVGDDPVHDALGR